MAAEDNGYWAGSVGFAFLAGAIIGMGAALLLAPQSGAETRKLLKTYAEKSDLTAAFEVGKDAMKKDRVS
jgi:gas vesicle protein